MKRIIAILLCALVLSGCAASAPAETTQVPAMAQSAPETTPETAAETEPPVAEGELFLKVSAITFATVGESEDVYLGLIPRELVTWESEDPGIVSVENGVLTAAGVGKTTIRGTYADRSVSCVAGCLAEDAEGYQNLRREEQNLPKRLPPEIDLTEHCTDFDNAALVGDSISWIFSQNEARTNYLGGILFLARGGVSMNGFVRRFKNIYFRGDEMFLEDAIAASEVDRVYFLMGSNDVSDEMQRSYVFENWVTLVSRIRELRPDVELVLMSNIPEHGFGLDTDVKNDLIEEYNRELKAFAEENDCLYLDLAYYIQDQDERMPGIYSQDVHHMNEAGCEAWAKVLRFYAQYEKAGGSLS